MEKSQRTLKKELRKVKLECIAFKLILLFIKPNALKLYGLIMAFFWIYISYKCFGKFKANALIQLFITFIFVKYYLIPGSEEVVKRGYRALEELYLEKDSIKFHLQQLKSINNKDKSIIQ